MVIWAVIVGFLVLFLSHAIAVWAGWRMGKQVGSPYLSVMSPKQTAPEGDYMDIFDRERLDVE